MNINYEYAEKRLGLEEGVKSKVYLDTKGIPTVGIGRNLRDVGLSPDEITYLFKNDVKRVLADIERELPWASTLDEARQFVVFDMCFNMGINKLKTFVNTLLAIKNHEYDRAAQGMEQSLWYIQVGMRAKLLVNVMRTGVLPKQ